MLQLVNTLILYQFIINKLTKMQQVEQMYFAEEFQQIKQRYIYTKLGRIYSITAGKPGQPLILIVHGSGPRNSSEQYRYILQQYLVRISYLEKFYIVAIDCPGYGKSQGKGRQAVKSFPLQMFTQILEDLNYKNYFAMFGHSQGGAAIFNAVYENPSITEYLVMDRPVCGNIQRFRKFQIPTLLIYDIEDDGHPLWQGKLLYKQLARSQFYTYKNSQDPYWVPDNIWQKMMMFFSRNNSFGKKYIRQPKISNYQGSYLQKRKKNKSQEKTIKKTSIERVQTQHKKRRQYSSLNKMDEIKKQTNNQYYQEVDLKREDLLSEVKEIQKSEMYSAYDDIERFEDFEAKEGMKKIQEPPHVIFEENNQKKVFKKQNSKKTQLPSQKQSHQLVKNTEKKIQMPKDSKENIQQNNRCAICYQTFYLPMITNCNHTFCSKCLLQYLLNNDKCPLCRAAITKKNKNIDLHKQLLNHISQKDRQRRQRQFITLQRMLQSIIYVEIGNNSRQLQTKQSHASTLKKKYIWQIYAKPLKNFAFQEVLFNINMGNRQSKPVSVKQAPYIFQSRGTFSFSCQITIKPRNKQYAPYTAIYRIDVEPGNHKKIVALRKKCYVK